MTTIEQDNIQDVIDFYKRIGEVDSTGDKFDAEYYLERCWHTIRNLAIQSGAKP